MESSKVMDRLICGDVGYGKTEVAIRAAFKAAQEGKQVAYLSADHHSGTAALQYLYPENDGLTPCISSCSPVSVRRSSRRRVCRISEEGLFWILLIGTHRILSKDVKFKDLGLIIVDEEQRFGVAHKEKLKAAQRKTWMC